MSFPASPRFGDLYGWKPELASSSTGFGKDGLFSVFLTKLLDKKEECSVMLPVVAESIPAIVRVELEEADVSAVVYVLGFDDDKEDELKPEEDRSKP